jgi:hypothetical protein
MNTRLALLPRVLRTYKLYYFPFYLLNIVKILSMLQIIDICRLMSVSYPSEVEFAVLIRILAEVAGMCGHVEVDSPVELLVDRGGSPLRKRLAIDILGLNVGHEASIPGNVLRLDVLSGPSYPVVPFLGLIGELNLEVVLVLRGDTRVQDPLRVGDRPAARHQGAIRVVQGEA